MGKEWLNFRKIKDWATENADATDCSRLCSGCEKTWPFIRSEGRGEEYLHMVVVEKGQETPCGLPFKFYCDTCYQKL